jgi:hypothetical protein
MCALYQVSADLGKAWKEKSQSNQAELNHLINKCNSQQSSHGAERCHREWMRKAAQMAEELDFMYQQNRKKDEKETAWNNEELDHRIYKMGLRMWKSNLRRAEYGGEEYQKLLQEKPIFRNTGNTS